MFLADIKELFAAFPTTKSPEEARKLKELNLLLTSKNKNAHFLFFFSLSSFGDTETRRRLRFKHWQFYLSTHLVWRVRPSLTFHTKPNGADDQCVGTETLKVCITSATFPLRGYSSHLMCKKHTHARTHTHSVACTVPFFLTAQQESVFICRID